MNSVEDDDFSHWDSLADELGLDPKTAPPKPPEAVKPPPIPLHPLPPVEVKQPIVAPQPEPKEEKLPEVYDESDNLPSEEVDAIATADTVLDEEEEFGDSETAETAEAETPEGGEGKEEGKGRRRRRRRRKKKGGGETPLAVNPPETDEVVAAAVPVPKPAITSKFVEPAIEESLDEGLDDAPEELLDEGDDKAELTTAMDEELTEETARPTPEWKVVSWTELVASLYRPER